MKLSNLALVKGVQAFAKQAKINAKKVANKVGNYLVKKSK